MKSCTHTHTHAHSRAAAEVRWRGGGTDCWLTGVSLYVPEHLGLVYAKATWPHTLAPVVRWFYVHAPCVCCAYESRTLRSSSDRLAE